MALRQIWTASVGRSFYATNILGEQNSSVFGLHSAMSPKNETGIILNIFYSYKLIAIKVSTLMALAIKRIYIVCHLTL